MSDIILGTAQFSPNYGVTNKYGTPSQKEIIKILESSLINNVKYIETSYNYKGVINKLIRAKNAKKFKYIFKIHLPNLINKKYIFIEKLFLNIQKKIGVKQFDYILIQNFDKFSKKKKIIKKVTTIIKKFKKKKIIKKFGISTYKFYNTNFLKKINIEAVQLPFSIFDQRLIKKNYHKKLKKKNIEIFIRSIFLQGLLLENYKYINKKFYKYSKYFKKFNSFCRKKNISNLQACLGFVKKFKEIKGVVVGVLCKNEIKEIIKNYNKKKEKIFYHPVKNLKLIDISKW